MPEAKNPKFLIDPKERVNPTDPKSPLKAEMEGPLTMKWYRDPIYRRGQEAASIAARWGISQRLSRSISQWLAANGITAYRELKAAGWYSDSQARKSFEAFVANTPKAPLPVGLRPKI